MTRAVQALAGAALLLAPAVLAFFSGGFFDEPRLLAGVAAFALVALAAVVSPRPLPRSPAGRAALGGLALLAAVTGLSMLWAPIAGPAQADFERVLLYVAVLAAGAAFLWPLREVVEPALAAGALLVIAYGLSERLVPGLVELERSTAAGGRLQQPLTYWNAVGAVAAFGLVLCARLAGTGARAVWLRAAAAGAGPVLALGLWLSFSRGAEAAALAGLGVLALAAPGRDQLRSIVVVLAAALPVVALTAPLETVRTLGGEEAARERHGLAMLAALVLAAAAAATVQLLLARREASGRFSAAPVRIRHRLPVFAVAAVVFLGGAVLAAAIGEKRTVTTEPGMGATSQRLATVESNRYAYWGVALGMFADRPLTGDGSRSFGVNWLAERDKPDAAKDAHSLYIETAGELGLAGLIPLAVFLLGAGTCAVRALRREPVLAAGPVAVLSAWALHTGVDWDWEMPAVSLIPIVLAGALIAWSERPPPQAEEAAAAGRDPARAAESRPDKATIA